MCGTGTNRRREGVGHALDRLLPGCCNTGTVSARSAFPHQRACKPRVTKSRALIRSVHGGVCLDPDAVLAALAKSNVACARLCRDKAEVGALVDLQLSESLSGHLHACRVARLTRSARFCGARPGYVFHRD